MNHFWHFARRMLEHRRWLGLCFGAALLDATCAAGGFASLMLVVDQLLGEGKPLPELLRAGLDNPWVPLSPQQLEGFLALLPEDRFTGFALVMCVILGLTLLGTCFRFVYEYAAITAAYRTVLGVRESAFHRLIHVTVLTMTRQGAADTVSRLVRDSVSLARGLHMLLGKTIRSILIGVACLLIAFAVNWMLSAVFLITLPIIGVLIRKFGKRIRRSTRDALSGYGQMVEALSESLRALAVVKVHQAEGYERRRFHRINRDVYNAEMKARTAKAVSSPVVEFLALAGVIGVALLAGWWVFNQGTPATDFLKVLAMLGVAGGSLRPLANLNNELQEASAAAERIREILELPVETPRQHDRDETEDKPDLPRHQREITFDHVSFAYPDAQTPAIDGVSLTIPHGQTIALVGGNGSGKSTLTSLIPRILEPGDGRVLIDGMDTADASLSSLRRQIGLVTQQTVLFRGTIAENIAYGQSNTPHDKVVEAATLAQAHDFVSALPHGYDTMLGEDGAGLSGGQRQRLCLARAVLRDPAIFILDEATSQVDAESEQRINEAVKAASVGRTTILIAHRLSTVMDADRIVMMNAGRIVDQGTHEQLLDRCESYSVLFQGQLI